MTNRVTKDDLEFVVLVLASLTGVKVEVENMLHSEFLKLKDKCINFVVRELHIKTEITRFNPDLVTQNHKILRYI